MFNRVNYKGGKYYKIKHKVVHDNIAHTTYLILALRNDFFKSSSSWTKSRIILNRFYGIDAYDLPLKNKFNSIAFHAPNF